MSEFDMKKDLKELKVKTPENSIVDESEDFGLGEYAAETSPETSDELSEEFAMIEDEQIEEVDIKKVASCFPDWSLTPDEMFKENESGKHKK